MSAPLRIAASDGSRLEAAPLPLFAPMDHVLHVADVLREVVALYQGQDTATMTHGDAYELVEHANRYAQCWSYGAAFQNAFWGTGFSSNYDGAETGPCVASDAELVDDIGSVSPQTHAPTAYLKALADYTESELASWMGNFEGAFRDTKSASRGMS